MRSSSKQEAKGASRKKIAVMTALIVVLCCVAAILLLIPLLSSVTRTPVAPPAQPTQVSAIASAEPSMMPTSLAQPTPSAVSSATIMLTGDMMCLGGQQSAAKNADGFDFSGSFAPVSGIFANADFVMGNLETTVSASSPLTTPSPTATADPLATQQKILPVLNAPPEYLRALRDAGVTAVSTVNNHCCDTGVAGITETIDTLDEYGIAHTGTYHDDAEQRYLLADVGGITVGFLAYSEFFNGKDGTLSTEERATMLGQYAEDQISADIAAARVAGAEFIVVYNHWGDENTLAPNGTQISHAQFLADAGADVIAGSHPHVLQKAEYIATTDGRNVLCFYSMGNFLSSMAQPMHNDTAIFVLELAKEADVVALKSASYIPCRVTSQGSAPFVVAPADSTTDAYARITSAIGNAIGILQP